MRERSDVFSILLGQLRKVVAARGGDPAALDREYVWPESPSPKAAVSLSPLLTGGQDAPPWAHGTAPSGVVPVPPGLATPRR
ncbi:MAG: hypothetical protein HY903_20880 [Deltaproteobacteria bacterium]|nr:hypothetical protein [Deltaproteobacteria bacterium]